MLIHKVEIEVHMFFQLFQAKYLMFVLQDQCGWKSDLPTILSVCLISLEPDSVLRVMQDQFTPGQIRDQSISG